MTGPAVPERALAIYAHPDDPEISAGGTIARWADAGCEVWILVTTRGEKGSTDPTTDRDALAEQRCAESEAAAVVLGAAGTINLGFDDGEIDAGPALCGALVDHVRRLRPDAVLCPDPTAVFFGSGYINHRDHRVTGWAALDAVAPAAANPHYFSEQLAAGRAVHQVREVYLSGTLEPNCWVDIEGVLERKIDALYCHASQLVETGDWFRSFLRSAAEDAAQGSTARFAEAFRRVQLAG